MTRSDGAPDDSRHQRESRHQSEQPVASEQGVLVIDGKAERRAVKVASADGNNSRLASGVSEAETVIVEAPPELKDGDKVKVAK